jgi:hypothetical protein
VGALIRISLDPRKKTKTTKLKAREIERKKAQLLARS